MIGILLKDVSISFGNDVFIKDISFTINRGEIGVLLGLSGSGKSTLLKGITGILKLTSGTIEVNGRDITDLPIRERKIGYVPQQQLLFPSLSIYENVAYGLRANKVPRNKIRQRVEEVSKLVGISHLIDREPNSLSGGERQRVALARAIAPSPDILLMDEPLSSLDTAERLKMALTLRSVIRELDITTVYVTHSPTEAEIMADTVVVINNGRLIQSGKYSEIAKNPQSIEVAGLLGIPNIFEHISLDDVDLQRYYNGLFYYIPPESIVFSNKGVPVKVIASTSTMTYILANNYILGTKQSPKSSDCFIQFH